MTLFKDMGESSRNGWLAWCACHDWGRGEISAPAWYDDMTGELVTYIQETDGFNWKLAEARHETPAQLKAWAGY